MGKPVMIINYANVQKHLHNIKQNIFTSLVLFHVNLCHFVLNQMRAHTGLGGKNVICGICAQVFASAKVFMSIN